MQQACMHAYAGNGGGREGMEIVFFGGGEVMVILHTGILFLPYTIPVRYII